VIRPQKGHGWDSPCSTPSLVPGCRRQQRGGGCPCITCPWSSTGTPVESNHEICGLAAKGEYNWVNESFSNAWLTVWVALLQMMKHPFQLLIANPRHPMQTWHGRECECWP
jgi:hypothetical protein